MADADERDDSVDVNAARVITRHRTTLQIVKSVRLVATIAVSALPLRLLRDSIVALAGQTTEVNAVVTVSVYVGLALTVTLAGAGWKVWAQRQELKKLRARVVGLESDNKRLRDLVHDEGKA